jgi:hypothetical protein
VAEIPELNEKTTLPAVCRSSIVSQTISFDENVAIIKVLWHSLSDHHLVVLTSDNTLRIVNAEQFDSGAEQIYSLEQMLEEDMNIEHVDLKIVNFCLGDASCASWQAFSIFLLNGDSDVYVLCPVVPFGCRISSHYFSSLRKNINSQLDVISRQLDVLVAKDARKSSRGRSPTSSASLELLQSEKLYLRSQLRWIAAICGIAHPNGVLDSSLELYTHNPNSTTSQSTSPHSKHARSAPRKWFFEISLQGPLETALSPDNSPQNAAISSSLVPLHDIFVISGIPTILGRSHASGHVELLVAINHAISPGWTVPGRTFQPNIPSLLLWYGVDLSTQSGNPDTAQNLDAKADKISPALLPTPPTLLSGLGSRNASSLYLYCSFGIVKVEIPWIQQLDVILSERGRTRDLPSTSLQLIWNSVTIDQNLPTHLGIAPYVKPFAPATQQNDTIFILSQFESGISLSTVFAPRDHQSHRHRLNASSKMAAFTESTQVMATSDDFETESNPSSISSNGIQFEDVLSHSTSYIRAPARLGPKTFRGASSTEAMSNTYNLQFYQHLSRQFDSCEEHLKSMEETMKGRIEILMKKSETDSFLYDDSCKRLSKAAIQEIELVSLLSQRKETHETFVKRMEAIKQVIRYAADRELPVDSAWISELSRIQTHLNKQKTSIESMETNIGTMSEELKSVQLHEHGINPDLDPSQVALYTTALNSQDKTISSLVSTLKKIQSQVNATENQS